MVLSFETSIALKSEINEKPKTIIPGVRVLISKMAVAPASGGMLLFIIEKSHFIGQNGHFNCITSEGG